MSKLKMIGREIIERNIRIKENNAKKIEFLIKVVATSGEVWAREELAENIETPREVLKELSKDTDAWVRWLVANNPKTPMENLKELANDENEDVKAKARSQLPPYYKG